MAALFNKCSRLHFKQNPMQQSKRYRGKINIQKPRAPHYEKARTLKLTEPYFVNKTKELSLLELCSNLKPKLVETIEDNPYEKIIAKECLNWFNHSKLISLFHFNPMSGDERFNAYIAFKKNNMHLKIYGRKTLKLALSNTNYEAFCEHYTSQNIIVFSPEGDIKQMLKISKKIPQIILLSGIFEGKYLSKDELVKFSAIQDVQVARAEFVRTLQTAGSQFVHRLTQQQNTLVARLEDRVEQLK